MTRIPQVIAAALGTSLLLAACGGTDNAVTSTTSAPLGTSTSTTPTTTAASTTSTTTTTTTVAPAPAPQPNFVLSVDRWPTLSGAVYEGWVVIDGAPVSTGRFNVIDGQLIGDNGEAIGGGWVLNIDLAAVEVVVISIEPADDSDPSPSDTKFLAGDVVDGTAELSIAHPAALGTDFSAAAGAYVLATPTDGNRDIDEFSGVWFLVFPGPTAGLDLPTLPAGWTYEGWTVLDGIALTTGTFLTVTGSDNEAPFSGTVRTPNFPGEDFLQNAVEGLTFPTDIRGSLIVITVEPLAEANVIPFDLTILRGDVPLDAEIEPAQYPLSAEGFVAPTGTVELR